MCSSDLAGRPEPVGGDDRMELCRGTGLQFTGAGRSRESIGPDCEGNHGTVEEIIKQLLSIQLRDTESEVRKLFRYMEVM